MIKWLFFFTNGRFVFEVVHVGTFPKMIGLKK